jgi:hypothetical protein
LVQLLGAGQNGQVLEESPAENEPTKPSQGFFMPIAEACVIIVEIVGGKKMLPRLDGKSSCRRKRRKMPATSHAITVIFLKKFT